MRENAERHSTRGRLGWWGGRRFSLVCIDMVTNVLGGRLPNDHQVNECDSRES